MFVCCADTVLSIVKTVLSPQNGDSSSKPGPEKANDSSLVDSVAHSSPDDARFT